MEYNGSTNPASQHHPHPHPPYFAIEDEQPIDHNIRQRRMESEENPNAGLYKELERLRSLVDVIEGERGGRRSRHGSISSGGNSNCFPVTLDNSVMSTVFGLVLLTIVTISIYAFHNLYRAISKRFFETPERL